MPIYTVTQVAQYVRQTVEEDRMLADLYVAGEVSNVSRSSAGHCYFTLKDGESQLRCVAFRDRALGADLLDNGAAVTAHGRVSFYAARGDLQYYVDVVEPEGVGELYLEFLRVKAKLEAEGLFDPARKRRLPPFPKRVAVVTSKAGAVLHDIQTVLSRRYPLSELLFLHTPVQGEQAVEGVIAAFRTLNTLTDLDVVILARGGGSLEELGAFNTEEVARAVHGSRVPVVSAIGHETDVTIADYVADLRAPTPSAAAELVAPDVRELRRQIDRNLHSSATSVAGLVATSREGLRHLLSGLDRLIPSFETHRQRVDDLTRSATATMRGETSLAHERLNARKLQLSVLHPNNTLSRGYALVERAVDKTPVSRVGDVSPGDGIAIQVTDGTFPAHVLDRKGVSTAFPRRSRKRRVPEEQQPLWEHLAPGPD